jgi:hypothetical protein
MDKILKVGDIIYYHSITIDFEKQSVKKDAVSEHKIIAINKDFYVLDNYNFESVRYFGDSAYWKRDISHNKVGVYEWDFRGKEIHAYIHTDNKKINIVRNRIAKAIEKFIIKKHGAYFNYKPLLNDLLKEK